jgi:hypothetical protein
MSLEIVRLIMLAPLRVGATFGRRLSGTIVARKRARLVHKAARSVGPIAQLLRHRNPAAF